MRFFISLAVEQQPNNKPQENFGIKPLPNLETRFLCANTLLSLSQPQQRNLAETPAVRQLQTQLAANREQHFHATNRPGKLQCRTKDKELRSQLAAALQKAGFPATAAQQIANWDPYNQNAQAD